ncbi:nucleotide exchange factor GrpE [Ruminococcaceae bacterium OttesenSCG-928-O06]|nr:nucleotide exchange factor GrpE [Ruminococcaceae bacterium OttesenSCG-928-O06]
MAENETKLGDAPLNGGTLAEEKPQKGKKAKAPKADNAAAAALEQQLADAQAAAAEAKDSLLRTAAEYDNYRRRSQKEQEAAFGHGVSHAVEQLLPVLDVLEAAAHAESTDAEYKKGVTLTLSKLEDIFTKLGVTEIDTLGKPFDPELHNCLMQDADSGAESGTVTKVLQKGYTLGDKVIRHSQVAVAP